LPEWGVGAGSVWGGVDLGTDSKVETPVEAGPGSEIGGAGASASRHAIRKTDSGRMKTRTDAIGRSFGR